MGGEKAGEWGTRLLARLAESPVRMFEVVSVARTGTVTISSADEGNGCRTGFSKMRHAERPFRLFTFDSSQHLSLR
jgi:hypothetical protein